MTPNAPNSGIASATVGAEEDGIRLDRWFKRHYPALGHGLLEKLLRTGQVRLDGKRTKASERLSVGQILRLPPQVHIIHSSVDKQSTDSQKSIHYYVNRRGYLRKAL